MHLKRMSNSTSANPPFSPLSADTLLNNLKARYAVKQFDPTKKIAPATWATLEQSMVLAPSSFGLQPWRFYVIENPEIRAKLRAFSWNQGQVTDASHMVVFARKKVVTAADVEAYFARVIEVRKAPAESLTDYKAMMLGSMANPAGVPGGSMDTYTRSQTYIALGFFLFMAAQLGIDACPMEGIDPAKYDETLNLGSTGFTTTVVATAGTRAATDWLAGLAKVRAKNSDLIFRV